MLKWKILLIAPWVPDPPLQRLNHRTWAAITGGAFMRGAAQGTRAGAKHCKQWKPLKNRTSQIKAHPSAPTVSSSPPSFDSVVVPWRMLEGLEGTTFCLLARDTFFTGDRRNWCPGLPGPRACGHFSCLSLSSYHSTGFTNDLDSSPSYGRFQILRQWFWTSAGIRIIWWAYWNTNFWPPGPELLI